MHETEKKELILEQIHIVIEEPHPPLPNVPEKKDQEEKSTIIDILNQ